MESIASQAWSKGKYLVKGMIIVGLVLLLLIPTFYVQNLVEEREMRQREAISEISSKWAGKQTITGPVLVLPYWQLNTAGANAVKQFAYLLPDQLSINATVIPQEKYRGIYKVMLYTTQVTMNGNMGSLPVEQLKIPLDKIIWNEAYIRLGVSDLKGLNEELSMKWKDSSYNLSTARDSLADGLTANLNITSIDDLKNAPFSAKLNLNGSGQLLFTPVGKTTSLRVQSAWPHPSFTGDILPQNSVVKDSGFTATWRSLSHTRKFPQQFKTGDGVNMTTIYDNSFGVDLFVPVSAYQKTMRSVKYAILCILLTFAAFYLIETVNNRSVHPLQYALIGLALVLFYTLLLSFSEYIGFNPAYIVSAMATIGLIAWFVKGILASNRLSMILGFVLLLMYSYIFTILQLQDFALILGSVGLFITLGIIMHFSRKMQW